MIFRETGEPKSVLKLAEIPRGAGTPKSCLTSKVEISA